MMHYKAELIYYIFRRSFTRRSLAPPDLRENDTRPTFKGFSVVEPIVKSAQTACALPDATNLYQAVASITQITPEATAFDLHAVPSMVSEGEALPITVHTRCAGTFGLSRSQPWLSPSNVAQPATPANPSIGVCSGAAPVRPCRPIATKVHTSATLNTGAAA